MLKIFKKALSSQILFYIIGFAVWFNAHYLILSFKYIFSHDSFHWYGLYHYFAEALQSGFLPLWNPYLHGGEIFFDKSGFFNFIDPVTIAVTLLGKVFSVKNLFWLYEMNIFIKLIVIAIGIQMVLNLVVPEVKKYSYLTFFTILLSSFSVNAYHQNGTFIAFSYIPFILYFLIRFLKKPDWFNTVFLGFFTGISCQSLYFAYNITFIILFLIFYSLFINFNEIKYIFKSQKRKLFAAVATSLIFALPALVMLYYRDQIHPYARFLFNPDEHTGIFMANLDVYDKFIVSSGAFGKIGDFLSLVFPQIAFSIYRYFVDGFVTEMNMYISIIPLGLGITGLFLVKHRMKFLFLSLLIASGILFIGPVKLNFLFAPIFYLIPFVRALEQFHLFANYFIFCLLFFVALGVVFLDRKTKYAKVIVPILFLFTLINLNTYISNIYTGITYPSLKPSSMITNTNLNGFAGIFFEQTILPQISSKADREYLLKYYQKKYNSLKMDNYSYILINNPVGKEREKLEDILTPFVLKGVNFEADYKFSISERKRKILPYFYGIIIPTQNKRYYLETPDMKYKLNFRALIEKESVALDFYTDFSPYDYLYVLNPTSLTYPVYYADILKSGISQALKSKILGVDLPVFDFYGKYYEVPSEEMLNSENNDRMLELIEKGVVISGKNDSSFSNITKSDDKPVFSIKIQSYNPQKIKLNISTDRDGLLLFRDGYHPDWKVKVDNRSEQVLRANYNSKAVLVKKGNHNVEFYFSPTAYNIAIILYLLGNIAVICFLVIYKFKSPIFNRMKEIKNGL